MKIKHFMLGAVAMVMACAPAFAENPKVIAHRGYWDTPVRPRTLSAPS